MIIRAATFLATTFTFVASHQLAPRVSKSVFVDSLGHGQPLPLATLRADLFNDGSPNPTTLDIFAEDPKWASKVEHFVRAAGADSGGKIRDALSRVHDVSWATGRTFRTKYVIMLFSSEDTQPSGRKGHSCRLTQAVHAASMHTTDAHFVAVADGFRLQPLIKETLERLLEARGWKDLTIIETPEFEGYSSGEFQHHTRKGDRDDPCHDKGGAINRAMKAVKGNTIVAVLSTWALLGNPGHRDAVIDGREAEHARAGSTGDEDGSNADDIFVAYERLHSSASPARSGRTGTCSSMPWTEAMRTSRLSDDHVGVYKESEYARGESDNDHVVPNILVTISPTPLAQEARQQEREESFAHGQYGDTHHTGEGSTETNQGKVSDETRMNNVVPGQEMHPKYALGREGEGAPTHCGSSRQVPQMPPPPHRRVARLADIARFPLLVFDTATFFALGELDEGFAFQGGIAEWISRAKPWHGYEGSGVGSDARSSSDTAEADNTLYQHRRRHRSIRRMCSTNEDIEASPEFLSGDDTNTVVQHLTGPEWGAHLVHAWQDLKDGKREDSGSIEESSASSESSESSSEPCRASMSDIDHAQRSENSSGMLGIPLAQEPSPSLPEFGNLRSWGEQEERKGPEGSRRIDGAGVVRRPNGSLHSPQNETGRRQWDSFPPTDLEALVEADADLFFLHLMRTWSSPDVPARKNVKILDRCVAFHADWMGRAPDRALVREALARRDTFPVAAVVVAHDHVHLMRATLEEVAKVVEHILVVVSLTPWHGEARDVSPTLHVLRSLEVDANSPAHSKIQVEVGTWKTEEDQREHGNALIRADPRGFARVVVIDTDEFWHPVDLTKALILAAQNPRAVFLRAEMDTYWASLRSVVSPPEILRPVWLLDPYRCRWYYRREVECAVDADDMYTGADTISRSVGVIHHLSYVRTDEYLLRKMAAYSHAGEEKSGWYDRSWLGWAADNSLTDLHPTNGEIFKRIVRQPLFRLTPVSRTLHLQARKDSWTRGVTASMKSKVCHVPKSKLHEYGTVERQTLVEVWSSEGVRPSKATTSFRAGDRPEGVDFEGCFNNEESNEQSDGGGNCAVRRVIGCEGMPAHAWTDVQRAMCLIPYAADTRAQRRIERAQQRASPSPPDPEDLAGTVDSENRETSNNMTDPLPGFQLKDLDSSSNPRLVPDKSDNNVISNTIGSVAGETGKGVAKAGTSGIGRGRHLRQSVVWSNLEDHRQDGAFEKLCHDLPRSKHDELFSVLAEGERNDELRCEQSGAHNVQEEAPEHDRQRFVSHRASSTCFGCSVEVASVDPRNRTLSHKSGSELELSSSLRPVKAPRCAMLCPLEIQPEGIALDSFDHKEPSPRLGGKHGAERRLTMTIGFSHGTAYLETFLRGLFSRVFDWVDRVECILEPHPSLKPAIFVVGVLDGGCGGNWEQRCQDRTMALAERYSDSLIVFVSGEAADLSGLGLHQASVALLATTTPSGRPPHVPSFHLPNLVTSFAERHKYSPTYLLESRGRGVFGGVPVIEGQHLEGCNRNGSVAYMYSRCDRPIRQAMFDLLTDRGVAVDALGACQGLREPDRPPLRHGRMSPSWHDDAVDIYQKYRLVIAFENADEPGYITEKIANAFLAGAVPVYWGTSDALHVFNPGSFIHCGEFPNLDTCADKVAQVAGDDSLWEEYWSQPCVKGDQQTLREWLSWLPGPREKLISPGAVSQTDQYMSKNGLADWLTHTLREAFRKRYRDVVM